MNPQEFFGRSDDNWLSENQLELAGILSDTVKSRYSSFENSNEAEEIKEKINSFEEQLAQKLEAIKRKPKDYYVWSLLNPSKPESQLNFNFFDTERDDELKIKDNEIGDFIRNNLAVEKPIEPEEEKIAA